MYTFKREFLEKWTSTWSMWTIIDFKKVDLNLKNLDLYEWVLKIVDFKLKKWTLMRDLLK